MVGVFLEGILASNKHLLLISDVIAKLVQQLLKIKSLDVVSSKRKRDKAFQCVLVSRELFLYLLKL